MVLIYYVARNKAQSDGHRDIQVSIAINHKMGTIQLSLLSVVVSQKQSTGRYLPIQKSKISASIGSFLFCPIALPQDRLASHHRVVHRTYKMDELSPAISFHIIMIFHPSGVKISIYFQGRVSLKEYTSFTPIIGSSFQFQSHFVSINATRSEQTDQIALMLQCRRRRRRTIGIHRPRPCPPCGSAGRPSRRRGRRWIRGGRPRSRTWP